MRRLFTGAVVVGTVVAALLLSGASSSGKKTRTYKIAFDNAFGLVEGGDFRIGGVKAGKTTKFDVRKPKGHAPQAVVEAKVTDSKFRDFRSDASCQILQQSVIGEYYVDCQPGSKGRRLSTHGGFVSVTHNQSTIPQDLVNDIQRRPTRERLRLIITELGTGLAGRPDDLQAVLKRAAPGLRDTSKVLKLLGDQNQVIKNFVTDSDTVVAELAANRKDVSRWAVEAGKTAAISATRHQDISRQWHKLPRFLQELRPTMARLGELSDEQVPLLSDLRRAAPSLYAFFKRIGPFSEASRPATRSLGKSSVAGTKAFRVAAPSIRELKALAPELQPTVKPLRQLLQTIDDRDRTVRLPNTLDEAFGKTPPPP
ncbi:MAG: MlaD family protein, partial [Thermoleophilaceae bacterium]